MLNFRKLRQDFSSALLKEGKELHDKGSILSAKILKLDGDTVRLGARVKGAYDNIYECEVEIDRRESIAIDSNCDCPYDFDCQHIVAFLFYLEKHLDEILVAYSNETDIEKCEHLDEEVKEELKATFASAATKEVVRKDIAYQKEIVGEYITGASVLATSPFFLPNKMQEEDKAELGIVLHLHPQEKNQVDCLFGLRLAFRSKPLLVPNVRAFIDALYFREPITLAGRKLHFNLGSFGEEAKELLEILIPHLRFPPLGDERLLRTASLDLSSFGLVLERASELARRKGGHIGEKEPVPLGLFYIDNLEEPLCASPSPAGFHIDIDYLEAPAPTFLLRPSLLIEEERVKMEDVLTFESTRPGVIYKNIYYRFPPKIKRCHLKGIKELNDLAIPEPLFGTFIENSLPHFREYAEVVIPHQLNQVTTLPYTSAVAGRAAISYLDGEMEVKLFFTYENVEIPATFSKIEYPHIALFVGKNGILARNVVEEKALLDELFEDFIYDEKEGLFRCKSEKKIVEFMTEVIPRHQHHIKFECPENLADQFIYDETTFELNFKESDRIDLFEVEFKVNGHLKGVSLDLLWDCIATRKGFLELETVQIKDKKKKSRMPRILVLDLEKINPLVSLFDEIGIRKLEDHVEKRPLWSLASIQPSSFEALPIKFSMTKALLAIQKQILGEKSIETTKIPETVLAEFRNYQTEGVKWLERLRKMHLNGILADDMGLGKTLQAIAAITQNKLKNASAISLIVCPTSLLYNWKAEFNKFNPKLDVVVIDGPPNARKKLLKDEKRPDALITSYNLLQKDIEIYKAIKFEYLILDEGQYIKNRTTRNAKSVKQLNAVHRLILTGTPIENSLEELWSLFDFLMPGLLSSFDRFVEKYIRGQTSNLQVLKRKVSPFILRRMKEDVLDDLPPVSEILYHCHLTDRQKDLYHSYAASAKEELTKLVKREGFEKVQIHVLATLTRLKQICCHPAIFAKEKAESGDSAKYDMLMELLPNLIESKRKTVIFSQYTKMLGIIRQELEERGIPFAYLDGATKNRLEVVNEFNDNPQLPVFLVSLKAGGSGLNLTGADTVIHYDMWWNPAVENQALDRVHRIGQKKSVSSYKLITLNTIEEKIRELHNKKRGLVKKVIATDEEAIAKLTWEEVLELLQT